MPAKPVRWLKHALADMDRLLVWLAEKEDKETANDAVEIIRVIHSSRNYPD